MAWLDTDGVIYLWARIKSLFAQKTDVPQPSSTTPVMDGTASTGTATTYAKGDHVHPTDTSRAPLNSPSFTGTPTAPTAAKGTNTTQIATTAFVRGEVPDINAFLNNNAVPRAVADASGNDISTTYAKKTDIVGTYIYKGSVATANALPANPSNGDVYNIEAASVYGAAGANVAWNGTNWDSLGEVFSITAITNAEIDAIIDDIITSS